MNRSFTKVLLISLSFITVLSACVTFTESDFNVQGELDLAKTVGPYDESVGTNFGLGLGANQSIMKDLEVSGAFNYINYGLTQTYPTIANESYYSLGINAGIKKKNYGLFNFTSNPEYQTSLNYGLKVGFTRIFDSYEFQGMGGKVEDTEDRFYFAPLIGISQKFAPNYGFFADLSYVNLVKSGGEPFSYIQFGAGIRYYFK